MVAARRVWGDRGQAKDQHSEEQEARARDTEEGNPVGQRHRDQADAQRRKRVAPEAGAHQGDPKPAQPEPQGAGEA